MRIDKRYQGHAKALSKYGLSPKIVPTLKEIWMKADASEMNNDANSEKRSGGRRHNAYLCTRFSKIRREKIYNIIEKLRDSNGITWLRMRMSYCRLPNLEELLQGDLVIKNRRDLAYKYVFDRECNCN